MSIRHTHPLPLNHLADNKMHMSEEVASALRSCTKQLCIKEHRCARALATSCSHHDVSRWQPRAPHPSHLLIALCMAPTASRSTCPRLQSAR